MPFERVVASLSQRKGDKVNKLIRLSPTGIEYGDYAWNFASGCGNNIDGKCKAGGFRCWAYLITQRFGGHYPNGFNPTIYPEALLSPLYLKKPSRILCAFMGDLFWKCPEFDPDRKIESIMPSGKASVTMSLKGWIFTTIKQCPQHTFLFLTKQPQNLPQFSPFPDNCWVGVTATDAKSFLEAGRGLEQIEAKVKYISAGKYNIETELCSSLNLDCSNMEYSKMKLHPEKPALFVSFYRKTQ